MSRFAGNGATARPRLQVDSSPERPSGRTYRLTTADRAHRIRLVVTARNRWGHRTATSRATAVIAAAGAPGSSSSPTPGGGGALPGGTGPGGTGPGGASVNYFATVPSSQAESPPAGIPRPDATCAVAVDPQAEVRPQNTTANNTVPPSSSSVDWGTALNDWTKFVNDDRAKVTGDYTGTTGDILQWVSCKWGIDVNLVRADAWIESELDPVDGRGHLQPDPSPTRARSESSRSRTRTARAAGFTAGGPTRRTTRPSMPTTGGPACGPASTARSTTAARGSTTARPSPRCIATHGEDYALWGCIGVVVLRPVVRLRGPELHRQGAERLRVAALAEPRLVPPARPARRAPGAPRTLRSRA